MNNAKDTVEKLYKGNGKLYFACLFVGKGLLQALIVRVIDLHAKLRRQQHRDEGLA